MTVKFEVGKWYTFYRKQDTTKTRFTARFDGGRDPYQFHTEDGTVYASHDLVYVASSGTEVRL